MRLPAVEKKARSCKIQDTWKYSKDDLIKMIQQAEGVEVCYKTPMSKGCAEEACCWRPDCRK